MRWRRWRRAIKSAWREFRRELAGPPKPAPPMTFEDAARQIDSATLVKNALRRGADIAAGHNVEANQARLTAIRTVLQEREHQEIPTEGARTA